MYGGYRNSGIHMLRDYEQALDWFNKTTPIRGTGCNAGVRPLGHRDRPHFQILKGDADEVICKCYQTNVVTFMPDGVIKITDGIYISQTIANFIVDVLGVSSRVEDHDIIVCVQGNNYRVRSGLELRCVDNRYEVTKREKVYSHTVNRKAMKQLRNEIAPFMQYLSGSIKVRGGDGFSEDEKQPTIEAIGFDKLDLNLVPTWHNEKSVSLKKLYRFLNLVWSNDTENWYRASCWLAWSQYPRFNRTILNYESAVKMMDKILMATHRGALIQTEVPEGHVCRDRYASLTKLREAE